jgi:peptidoglycan/LPS O-acetylase OafA/YrhL
MSSSTRAVPATTGTSLASARSVMTRSRVRRRALMLTAALTVGSFALFVDLLMAGHTVGEEVWGPVTAIAGTVVGLLSLAYLAMGGRRRAARILLYALWAVVAFFGFGGYNDHRLPRPADTITDQRERPPLAPLAFTGIAIVGAFALRSGSKGE